MLFSTPNADNGSSTDWEGSTFGTDKRGFWFGSCDEVFLNSKHYPEEFVSKYDGVQWRG